MYGLIGKIIVQSEKRDELIRIILDGTDNMPGCLSYIICKDAMNDNTIWITEVWDSKKSHQASLSLPSVQAALGKGRPFIEDFGEQIETVPVGGYGLMKA
ncbi:antibiotic biosynthesis monooxygenase [Balneolaceae bacterium YR4-1]|uniref:Antibiotic biosynthesis monooxygenase n=2 Tax=Halalkalibaculum roseum TaxID=2709311 RepID=A0A6M1STJ2_9BACT|nr:antibiotic biosynthesis monooxygenase [Halalkalibaculum roseum]